MGWTSKSTLLQVYTPSWLHLIFKSRCQENNKLNFDDKTPGKRFRPFSGTDEYFWNFGTVGGSVISHCCWCKYTSFCGVVCVIKYTANIDPPSTNLQLHENSFGEVKCSETPPGLLMWNKMGAWTHIYGLVHERLTPLLTHWSYVFLALTHRYALIDIYQGHHQVINLVEWDPVVGFH